MNSTRIDFRKDFLKYSFFLSLLYILIIYLPVNYLAPINFDDIDVLTRIQGCFSNIHWTELFFRKTLTRYYRPLLEVLCYLDYAVWGSALSAWHLTNYILHILNAVMLYLIARSWFESEKNCRVWACIAMLLFALNPLACESVAWISGRSDLAGTFFALIAVRTYYLKSRLKYVISPIAILAGLLCKENALAVIPIIVLLEAFQRYRKGLTGRKILQGCLLWIGLVSLPLLVYLFFRTNGFEYHTYFHANAVAPMVSKTYTVDAAYLKSIFNIGPVTAFYIKKLFIPYPLNFAISRINTPVYALLFLIITFINAYCIARKKWALPYFFLLLVISFSPALFVAMGGVAWVSMAERYLYLSLSVSAVGLATLFLHYFKRRTFSSNTLVAVLGIIILSWSVSTFVRQFDFKNDKTIWTQTLKTNPNNGNVLFMYGNAVGGIEGQKAYHKALDNQGPFTFKDKTHFNIAVYESKSGNLDTAVNHIEQALAIRRSYENYHLAATILLNFATMKEAVTEEKYIRKALGYLRKAYAKRPSAFILNNMAMQLTYLGETDEADKTYRELLEKYPDSKYAGYAKKHIEK